MKTFKLFITGLFTSALIACGGGGSDAGGAGTRVFSATGTLVANGESTPISLTITISGNSVTITDGADSGSAPLGADGNNFSVPVNLTSDPTVTCNAPIIVNGQISGTNVNGTFSGRLFCTVAGAGSATVVISGTYRGTQTSASKARSGSRFVNALVKAIQ